MEEASARARCRAELEQSGFACREIEFAYSQWPGRWGPFHIALAQAVTIVLVARTAMQWGALVALVIGAAIASGLFLLLGDAKRRWTTDFRLMRSRSKNLEATKGDPILWLVAHIDSKAQTIPMLFRIAGSIAQGVIAAITLLMLVAAIAGFVPADKSWMALQIAAVLAAIPTLLCWIRNDSKGAVDNASGVAAVLLAARELNAVDNLGVLITSGEELGLAGARVWAGTARRELRVVNCDTVDDHGSWRCMYSGKRPALLTTAVETSASGLGFKFGVGRMIPGILADNIAFTDIGIDAVTISRGTLSTLARIHTRRDNSTALTGKGAADAARLLSDLARHLA